MVSSISTSATIPTLRLPIQNNGRSTLFFYQLVAKPQVALAARIKDEQHWFFDDYLEKKRNQDLPMLSFCNFYAFPAMEETLGRWMQRICGQQVSFIARLINYGGTPPHSIYMRAQPSSAFEQFAASLKAISDYVVQSGCPEPKIYAQPRLTIAHHLPEPVYEKALINYAQRDFKDCFAIEELFLLKRQYEHEPLTKAAFFRLPA